MGDFFRDYGTPFASAVAVLNGFIAVLIAQLFQDCPTAKVFLVASAGLLGAVAICATFYTQRQIVATRDADAAKKKYIREQLGKFIEEGVAIKSRCQDSALPIPLADANDWKERVEMFLETKLCHSYVISFRDRTGIFQSETIYGDDAHTNMWDALYNFIFRLEQFSQKLPI
ncbi:MAG: hypothetical protein M3178_02975 [Pseudomonadota bacterium]|nr:hypothetical protein [Pseudomonadota bacterium]